MPSLFVLTIAQARVAELQLDEDEVLAQHRAPELPGDNGCPYLEILIETKRERAALLTQRG